MNANAYSGVPRAQRTNSSAVASLVFGILGVIGGFPLGIVAIIVGRRAIRQIGWTGDEGYGIARVGTILGWISVWLAVPALLLLAAASCSGPVPR
jgi:ABC-type lipoprotein release transport system permease subunit